MNQIINGLSKMRQAAKGPMHLIDLKALKAALSNGCQKSFINFKINKQKEIKFKNSK